MQYYFLGCSNSEVTKFLSGIAQMKLQI
uniref:Uncharacterized protein n=1 Tax=Arundo donax TaxID=35708 RepID=A0A0A8YXD0_ARUDO